MDELDTGKLRAVLAKYIPIRETYLTSKTVNIPNAVEYRLVSAEFDHAAVNALPTLLDTIDTLRRELVEARAENEQLRGVKRPIQCSCPQCQVGERARALASEASHD